MAENTVKRMKEQLQCCICLCIYSEPKQLQCNHIFCQKCLEQLGAPLGVVTCPTCRQPTTVPANGVPGLQPAYNTQSMLEIITSGDLETANDTDLEECPVKKKAKIHCPSHDDRAAELYCETCEQLICYKCAIKGGFHNNHDCKDLGEAYEGYMTEMKERVTTLEKFSQEVSTQQAAILAKVFKNAEQLHADIEHRKAQILSELNKVAEKKLSTIKTQIQGATFSVDRYQNPSDVLSNGVLLINQMKKTANTFRAENMKPDIRADMILLPPTDDHANNLGQLLQCYATGEGLTKMNVSQSSTVILHCHTTDGKPYRDRESLRCRLIPESRFLSAQVSINEISQWFCDLGQFSITCHPTDSGWHQLHIEVSGQHIKGSPFQVYVHVKRN